MTKEKLNYSFINTCAPVIKGLTIANTITGKKGTCNYLLNVLDNSPLSIHLLHKNDKNEIILIYREANLKEYLFQDEVKTYLKELGYKRCDLNYVLNKLTKRFSSFYLKKTAFPHELGIILNYPIEDIKGFIENQGQNYLACKYWKVYSNLNETLKVFKEFDKALETSLKQLLSGYRLNEIIEGAI